MKRVGLLGGSFDPVHNAHIALARLALVQLQLDQVRWIPAGQPWQKSLEMASAQHREAMLRLAIAGEPSFTLDTCELQRSGPTYTIDTVRALHAAEPRVQWFLIIGQDQHARLHTWKNWQALLKLVTLVVAGRPGVATPGGSAMVNAECSTLAFPPMDLSSTEIRKRIAQSQAVDDLVPTAVARYIDRHYLYRRPTGS